MGKFCTNCGSKLDSKASFCGMCGTAIVKQAQPDQSKKPAASINKPAASKNKPEYVGFSEYINNPEVVKEIDNRNKKGRGCIFIGIPLPFIIFMIASLASDEIQTMDALVFGGGISVLFLIFFIIGEVAGNKKSSWEGVVVDKKRKNKSKRMKDGELRQYTEFVIIFRTDSGKKKLSVTSSYGNPEFRDYYDYLKVGDRVRYHPQLPFHYEKYDKSNDSEIPCMFCKTMNDIENDRCEACSSLLFK